MESSDSESDEPMAGVAATPVVLSPQLAPVETVDSSLERRLSNLESPAGQVKRKIKSEAKPGGIYECHYCSKTFAVQQAFAAHMRHCQKKKEKFSVANSDEPMAAVASPVNLPPQLASVEAAVTPLDGRLSKLEATAGQAKSKAKPDGTYVCHYCSKAFAIQGGLNLHMAHCQRKKQKFGGIYVCHYCSKAFDVPQGRTLHMTHCQKKKQKFSETNSDHDREMSEPVSKKRRLPKEDGSPISKLPNDLLAKLFTYVPLADRFQLNRVCRHWAEVSRIAWVDVMHIDLSDVPTRQLRKILDLCPKLSLLTAYKHSIDALINELHDVALPNLASLNLAMLKSSPNAAIVGRERQDNISWCNRTFTQFLQRQRSLTRFSLHVDIEDKLPGKGFKTLVLFSLPASLTHLQLTGLTVVRPQTNGSFLTELAGVLTELTVLECLFLEVQLNKKAAIASAAHKAFCQALSSRYRLRELCLLMGVEYEWWPGSGRHLDAAYALPNLEVFFISEVHLTEERLARLTLTHPKLRILLIEFSYGEDILLPARNLYPLGTSSNPLPQLHIFLGESASDGICFTRSAPDAITVLPINKRMPEFLSADIFGVAWVAQMIKAAHTHDPQLWGYAQYAQSIWYHDPTFEVL